MGEKIKKQRVEKSAITYMRVNCLIAALFLLAAEGITVAVMKPGNVPAWLWIFFVALIVFMAGYSVVSPKIRYEKYWYSIDEEAIRVGEGFLWVSYNVVPIARLHKIELSQGPIARIFQFYTVCVTTAGSEVEIKFIKEDMANEIAEHLKDVINQIAEEERKKK